MTTETTIQPAPSSTFAPVRDRPGRVSPRNAVSDALALTWRNLLRYVRLPQLLVFATVQPTIFVLMFRYVFGGSINLDVPGLDYVDY